jgi:hypothetical protein
MAVDKLGDLKAACEVRWETRVVERDRMRDAFVHSFHDFKLQI